MNAKELLSRLNIDQYLTSLIPDLNGKRGFEKKICCVFHNERTPSMSVNIVSGMWHCFGCSEGGDIIDLTKKLFRCDFKEAMFKVAEFIGDRLHERPSYVKTSSVGKEVEIPVPDKDKIMSFHDGAFMDAFDMVSGAKKYAKKRNIDLELVNDQYSVGFMSDFQFGKWKGWQLQNAWCFPIPDHTKENWPTVAIKLHFETPPKAGMKSMWAPFGTMPSEHPKHGFATLWPAPEYFDADREICLCPGELKALAFISNGLAAISITTGEGFKWTDEHATRLSGRDVVVWYDDDVAGHKFRDSCYSGLKGYVNNIEFKTFGAKK